MTNLIYCTYIDLDLGLDLTADDLDLDPDLDLPATDLEKLKY